MDSMHTLAWELYCKETAGDMHVLDFWEDLPKTVQYIYLEKARSEIRKRIKELNASIEASASDEETVKYQRLIIKNLLGLGEYYIQDSSGPVDNFGLPEFLHVAPSPNLKGVAIYQKIADADIEF